MFKLVKSFDTGEPVFFLLCDHRQCMEARRGSAVMVNQEEYRLARKEFLKSALTEGWWIDLEGAYCPPHAQEMLHAAREAEERGRQTVAPARPADILAFGKGR